MSDQPDAILAAARELVWQKRKVNCEVDAIDLADFARAQVDAAVRAEREACAQLAETTDTKKYTGNFIAACIRARGEGGGR